MPAQKRSLPENLDDEESSLHHQSHTKQSRNEDGQHEAEGDTTQVEEQQTDPEQEQQNQKQDPDDQNNQAQQLQADDEDEEDDDGEEEDEDDSDGSQSSTSQEKPEFVFVELPEIRKDVQCPICLGIIKKTRTVMECLHRFCRECIDKSMRLGNNECPACRTHCASRRSLRDDPKYDALIAALYPDIDKYEKEELAFHEEERTHIKQIQASIAQIFQRQSEALVKRHSLGKESRTSGFMNRSQRHHRSSHPRRRRNSRGVEHQGSEDNEDENDDNGGKDSSFADDHCTEVRQRRRKRWTGIRMALPSSVVNSDGGYVENDTEVSRDRRGLSLGLVWNLDMLVWGRGGVRSHIRHGNMASGSSKSSHARLNRLVEYLRSLEENDDELDVHLKLISVDEHSTSSLQQPYLCCRPSLSVKQLYEDEFFMWFCSF
ncbi:putative E3 ubiquitin-protein ligase RING1a isoform X2 [Hibiscus syriacus]|uniref:putative E3 ubiquitin-protein ligase RING1a isoform X2 n=1 Tax=Hibiscus syriacus TaxID=106335 RepID=UPI00192074F2|nr:putative E3 ubiquitin-protein ligase RING1a isoform X2 [Hibiscus syriacus]